MIPLEKRSFIIPLVWDLVCFLNLKIAVSLPLRAIVYSIMTLIISSAAGCLFLASKNSY